MYKLKSIYFFKSRKHFLTYMKIDDGLLQNVEREKDLLSSESLGNPWKLHKNNAYNCS